MTAPPPRRPDRLRSQLAAVHETLFFVASVSLLAAGLGAQVLGARTVETGAWTAATGVGLLYATADTVITLVRRRTSVDVIAVLALVGSLAVGEPLAGAVVTVMLATGRVLEARARARAGRELTALVARAPRTARRRCGDTLEEVPVEQVDVGDRVVVASGEIVPVDGRLAAAAVLDESSLTGEARPVERPTGDDVRSGVVNAGPPFELLATTTSADSTYAALVRLVKQAQAASSPFVRLADRLAAVFVPATLLLAGGAWLWSGDAVRAVAVLVVATPCPLLLAAPIAIISGTAQAARIGVVVKGGAALEQLAAGRTILFDKTGTLTAGRPRLVHVAGPATVDTDRMLALAASLDQLSPHPLATSLVTAAARRGLPLSMPVDVQERHGYGLEGTVGGRRVQLGKPAWVLADDAPAWAGRTRGRAELDGAPAVFMAVDGAPAGAFLFADPIRPDAPRTVRDLRAVGIDRVVLLTGDRADAADAVGRFVGVDAVIADCTPTGKLAVVEDESRRAPTIMVGDGINDAPSLAAAGVGVALAAAGTTAASEAADVVLTVDRAEAVADAVRIARRARGAARLAAGTGMGLAAGAMVAAAAGLLAPVTGAVLQEGIDVLAIVLALLALLPPRGRGRRLTPAELARAAEVQRGHDAADALADRIAAVADTLTDNVCDLRPVRLLLGDLDTILVPHERDDDDRLVPLLAKRLGGEETVAALHAAHAEIERQVHQLRRVVEAGGAASREQVVEVRRRLYELDATLRLHNLQEVEGVSSWAAEEARLPAARGGSRTG